MLGKSLPLHFKGALSVRLSVAHRVHHEHGWLHEGEHLVHLVVLLVVVLQVYALLFSNLLVRCQKVEQGGLVRLFIDEFDSVCGR